MIALTSKYDNETRMVILRCLELGLLTKEEAKVMLLTYAAGGHKK